MDIRGHEESLSGVTMQRELDIALDFEVLGLPRGGMAFLEAEMRKKIATRI